MTQRGDRARLVFKAGTPIRSSRGLGAEEFDRDDTSEAAVASLVDLSHPADALERQNLVRTNARAGGQCHVPVGRHVYHDMP